MKTHRFITVNNVWCRVENLKLFKTIPKANSCKMNNYIEKPTTLPSRQLLRQKRSFFLCEYTAFGKQ